MAAGIREDDQDHGGFDWKSWLLPFLVLLGLLAFAYGVGSSAWDWVNRYAAEKTLEGKDFVVAKLDVVKLSLSIVAGGGALYALYLGHKRQRTAEDDLKDRRKAQRYTELDADERRVTELYTKAADQLGSDKAAVRLAGLYALERLAQTAVHQRQTIMNVLCAYLRMPFELPVKVDPDAVDLNSEEGGRLTKQYVDRVQEHEVRLAAQRILTSHLRPSFDPITRKAVNPDYWGGDEHADLDLTGAVLVDFNLSGVLAGNVTLRDAVLAGDCDFASTIFDRMADFTGVSFVSRGRLGESVSFAMAEFRSDVRFTGASFGIPADFGYKTNFQGTADFSDVKFLARVDFSGVVFDEPTNFRRAAFGYETAFTGSKFARFEPDFADAVFRAGVDFSSMSSEQPVDLSGAWVEFSEDEQQPTWRWPDGWRLGSFDSVDRGEVQAKLLRIEPDPVIPARAE